MSSVSVLEMTRFLCQVLPTSERDPYASTIRLVLYFCRAFLLRGGNNFVTAFML